ncbi:MAG: oxidoreductase, partial [Planctomycetaceae bacterium]|nr:oxidoreductase [Planctomycetaceae bacterium]
MIPELHLPWLELTILIPLLGSIALIFIRDPVRSRSVATLLCGVTLLTSVGEWLDFSPLHSFEAHDHWDLFQLFFHRYIFVVDELSAPLLPLTALIYLMTVVSTLRTKVQRFSFTMTLFSLAVVMATLSCKEPWIIVALMSLSTVPPWLEMKARGQCTRVYSIHMGLFVVMLIAGLAIVRSDASPENPSVVAGAMLTFAALLRSGIVPVHCWMTDLFEKA